MLTMKKLKNNIGIKLQSFNKTDSEPNYPEHNLTKSDLSTSGGTLSSRTRNMKSKTRNRLFTF